MSPKAGRRAGRLLFGATLLAVTVPATVYVQGAVRVIQIGTQTAADAAALAAAGYLLTHGAAQREGAIAEAIKYANLNSVLGYTPELRREDVVFDEEAGSVSVLTRVILVRMPAPFASLGLPDASVTAHASAEGSVGGTRPAKVLRLVDECRWEVTLGRRDGNSRSSQDCK